MTEQLDRERLTAYVLDELNERERDEIEGALLASPAAQRLVNDLKSSANLVREAYQEEEVLALDPARRERILGHASEDKTSAHPESLEDLAAQRQEANLCEGKTSGIRPKGRKSSILVLVSSIGLAGFAVYLLLGVVPGYARIFNEFGGALPWPTRAVIAVSEFLRQWWWFMMLVAAGFTVQIAVSRYVRRGRKAKERTSGSRGAFFPGRKRNTFAVASLTVPLASVVLIAVALRLPLFTLGDTIFSETELAQEQSDNRQIRPPASYYIPPNCFPAAPLSERAAPASTGHEQTLAMSPEMREALSAMGYLNSDDIAVGSDTRTAQSRRFPPEIQALYGVQSDAMEEPSSPYNDRRWNFRPGHNSEAYDRIVENPFLTVAQNPLSTFSIDVDTASYANVRRFLNQYMLPPPDAVRIEELVNYFDYGYEPPEGDETPFAARVTVASCPWRPEHRLARIGLKGWEMSAAERPPSNLVFLLDVSGSMRAKNKLPLVKKALKMLVWKLSEDDHVAMVVYAGASGLVLPPTPGDNRRAILRALNELEAGGSTHGSAGIQQAYDVAVQNFVRGGTNRVILATDGDFNVGTTNRGELTRLIEEKARSGVFLTVLGFGMGNLKDATMEQLADKGNGNYAYIDTEREAKKVLVRELGATLVTIAKDVKIQVEFNPAQVSAYRLIGYENRMLRAEDFNDDTKDAGEIGAGHTVTALYELAPTGQRTGTPAVDPLRYQQPPQNLSREAASGEAFTLKLRYKAPDGDTSKLLEFPIVDEDLPYARADKDFKFAASVASFGMLLRGSAHKGSADFDTVLELAQEGLGRDPHGYREEFLGLVQKAKYLKPRK